MVKSKKIMCLASSGGHLDELMQLEDILKQYETVLVTEKSEFKNEIFSNIYNVEQINRKEKRFVWNFFRLFIDSWKIYKKERPDVMLSTGALATIPLALIGKLGGCRIVYIESFARVTKPSTTGKIMYRISDVFVIQWKELKKYYPKAIYLGSIF